MTGIEIAEVLELPPALERAWHTHGYYGSVSHNVKAIYQRYLGWFDGNPAHLWAHPPVEPPPGTSTAWAAPTPSSTKARRYADDGDLRFAAQVLNHVVFADPDDAAAKELLADTYERLGLRRRERHLAELLPHGRARSSGTGSMRPAADAPARSTCSSPCRSRRSSTRSPSGSTVPGPGTSTSRSTGASPTSVATTG